MKNIDPVFEPHYNTINQPAQIQIYEMILGDENSDLTTVIERADHSLKDNRIPPEGFVTTFSSYDTIKIVGDALNDPDFNKNGNNEGSGRDEVHYHIPLSGNHRCGECVCQGVLSVCASTMGAGYVHIQQ